MTLKIKHKLFFAILMANIFVILGIYILSSVSFSSSFREYLDANREKELAPLVAALANEYPSYQNWGWLKDRRDPTWRDLVDKHLLDKNLSGIEDRNGDPSNRRRQQERPAGARDARPPPPRQRPQRGRPPKERRPGERRGPPGPNGRPPIAQEGGPRPAPPRIFVANAQKQLILGRQEESDQINWITINVAESTVGYLGYYRTSEITSKLDRLFLDRLNTYFGWSVILVILVAALIALALSRILTNPITRLRSATRKMSSGEFATRIRVTNRDEIGELCNDFNQLAKSLESNLQARQQWIADISHELRTPVSILQGELEAIQDGVRDNNKSTIDSLHQEIKRLSFLINDLHELSMSDLGTLSYSFESIDLMEVIDDVIESNFSRIEHSQFSIEHLKSFNELICNGDTQRLTQLFLNLLNNSLSYSDRGGTIKIEYEKKLRNVIIRWCDTEPGVSDEQLTKLFDRLYRAETSRNRNSGGSGLGLSISNNIVEAHNGTMCAKHSPLGGVTFEITLPLIA